MSVRQSQRGQLTRRIGSTLLSELLAADVTSISKCNVVFSRGSQQRLCARCLISTLLYRAHRKAYHSAGKFQCMMIRAVISLVLFLISNSFGTKVKPATDSSTSMQFIRFPQLTAAHSCNLFACNLFAVINTPLPSLEPVRKTQV